ncbi:MAG: CDP-alcohol phosphatidyltransferase family protein, partial [Candidatus Omnitrophica bacterium]|nr:CDP-alcohol phosphatidyltransferase family protein [Candidatus Omnitrophota bacterium]
MMMYLFPSYRKQKFDFLKKNESWSSVLFLDPLMIPLIILIKERRDRFPFYFITPNAVSLASFVVYFSSIMLFFLYPKHQPLCVLGLLIAVILDGIDGQLARATGRASRFGGVVDAFFDMFKYSLGLILIAVALAYVHHTWWLVIVMTPYALLHGTYHINNLTKDVLALIAKENLVAGKDEDIQKTSWHRFCDRRGFVYSFFTEFEASTLIFLSIIVFKDPSVFIAALIGCRFLYWP